MACVFSYVFAEIALEMAARQNHFHDGGSGIRHFEGNLRIDVTVYMHNTRFVLTDGVLDIPVGELPVELEISRDPHGGEPILAARRLPTVARADVEGATPGSGAPTTCQVAVLPEVLSTSGSTSGIASGETWLGGVEQKPGSCLRILCGDLSHMTLSKLPVTLKQKHSSDM